MPAAAHATDATILGLWRQIAATWHAQAPSDAWGGTMDDKSILLIRRSFAQVAEIAAPAAILFYGRLFRLDPSMREIFAQGDMRVQGARFIAALGDVVSMLDKPEQLLPAVHDEALRLGLRPEHYRPLGDALEWMLEECLAEDFSPELRNAWNQLYQEVTGAITGRGFHVLAA